MRFILHLMHRMPWDRFLRQGRAVEMLSFGFYSTENVLVSSYGPEMKYIQVIHKENAATNCQKTLVHKTKDRCCVGATYSARSSSIFTLMEYSNES